MLLFKSLHNLFQIHLPEGWNHSHENNVYTFLNEKEVEGVLQISPYSSNTGQFNPDEEFERERKTHPSAQVVDLSHYNAIHYGVEDSSNKTIQYYWIVGDQNVKLFCTLFVNSQQSKQMIDESYEKMVAVLSTLRISTT